MDRCIRIQGARTNNLRAVSCAIPHARLTVVTGVSGSGKSSLAFDTLFAEGQRRFVESMSTYARQFLERLERPDVDFISSIPPAIALEQRNTVRNARSTVGTATEITDFLRLLFAKIGRTVCPACQIEVRRDTVTRARLGALPDGARITVVAPLFLKDRRQLRRVTQEMIARGFHRLLVHGELVDLADADSKALRAVDPWPVVIDRIALRGDETSSRVASAIEQAYQVGQGRAEVHVAGGERLVFTESFSCAQCGAAFREPEPQMLSFNSPIGACPECNGFGRSAGVDEDRVIPNPALSLAEGAVAPWNFPSYRGWKTYMKRESGLPWTKPVAEFTAAERRRLWRGDGGEWVGIDGFFDYLERKKYKMHVRIILSRLRGYTGCRACGGSRLRPEALNIRVGGQSIDALCRLSIEDLRRWFERLTLDPQDQETAARLLAEIGGRLRYLDEVGLGYLTLARQTRTLSGGEAQRINLASALGSNLTATLYVLDEPTVGLHARDTHRLLRILHALRANGNTVVIIEHDPEVIRGADWIIDLGPGAGEHGGEVVFEGTLAQLISPPLSRGDGCGGESLTARWLRAEATPRFQPAARPAPARWLTVHGATGHNLRDLTVRFPLNRLVAVTGVSGSGKSTLAVQTLAGHLLRRQGDSVPFDVMPCRRVVGAESVDEVILVDQSPLARSIRSNPATYTKAHDEIRRLLATSALARARGIGPGHFSFNTGDGRCEACEGLGTQTIDMQFLADVTVTCEQCAGRRFKPHVLEIEHRGKSIDAILAMTIDEARAFFAAHPRIVRALQPLVDAGLGYLRLGQSTATLSGGEAQRLKLAAHLAPGRETKRHLFLLDEPTTGLHLADVDVLLATLDRLVRAGHSVIVIEHNLELIRSADWIIDLGPEGGDDGGRLLAQGPPSAIAACAVSHTGAFLRGAPTGPAAH
ncbi:MAG: excinuclease ABC subunit UvrA [Candidatus Sumerlaeia bacterium]|nr:excinuclease ABC subunit UvrA [Candidatus Sumerlaeia bacterium]